MISLLHNRRKYTAGQVVPSGGGAWLDFDLAKLGDPDHSVQFRDSYAGNAASSPLQCYNLQCLASGSLLVNAQYQGHAYIYDFNDNQFDLSQLIEPFTSRTPYQSGFYGAFIFPDGDAYYRYTSSLTVSGVSNTGISYIPLAHPFALSDVGTAVSVFAGASSGLIVTPQCFFISPDGRRFFYKTFGGNVLYCLKRNGAWPTSSASFIDVYSFYFSSFNSALGFSSTPNWNCFTFSPDGGVLVCTTNTMIVKFVLTTPWDLATASLHSYKTISSLSVNGTSRTVTLGGMAISNDGTRMILHNRSSSASYAAFYDFALSA